LSASWIKPKRPVVFGRIVGPCETGGVAVAVGAADGAGLDVPLLPGAGVALGALGPPGAGGLDGVGTFGADVPPHRMRSAQRATQLMQARTLAGTPSSYLISIRSHARTQNGR